MIDTALQYFGIAVREVWWIALFFILEPLFSSTWISWRQRLFKKKLTWTVLEMHIPREIRKSPRAMEQVLNSIHQLRNAPGGFRSNFVEGEVTRWFALEIVSFGGEIHFYIRMYSKFKDLVEAAIFSYYQDIELREVEDYMDRLPENIDQVYAQGYEVYGSEMVLRKDSAYPIKTYSAFEAPDEERQYDPISSLLEVLGKVKKEEIVAVQLLIAPAGPKWKASGEKLLEGLRNKKASAKKASMKFSFEHGPLPIFGGDATKPEEAKPASMTPGESDLAKVIENNLAKPAFDTLIRFIYLSPKTLFYDSYSRRGLISSFNQYTDANLNSFTENKRVATQTSAWSKPYVFPKLRNEYRKQRILHDYRNREIPEQTSMGKVTSSHFFNWNNASQRVVLTTESLATLFHPPTYIVLTAPHLRRLESRKAGPPAGLAIFGEEENIERFK